jgi:hypothetical protein
MEEWQRRWSKRAQAVRQAVEMGDQIIMAASDSSKEEMDYLTAQVAEAWMKKALMTQHSAIQKYDFEQDRKRENTA